MINRNWPELWKEDTAESVAMYNRWFMEAAPQATATNTYLLLYPKHEVADYIASRPDGLEGVHHALLQLTAQDLGDGGRAYGEGLRKIEPKELGMLDARVVRELLSNG